jgi:hypothetical protein
MLNVNMFFMLDPNRYICEHYYRKLLDLNHFSLGSAMAKYHLVLSVNVFAEGTASCVVEYDKKEKFKSVNEKMEAVKKEMGTAVGKLFHGKKYVLVNILAKKLIQAEQIKGKEKTGD